MAHLTLENAVVTGATGHLGNVLVRHLLERGVKVRVMVRATSDLTPLEGLDVEVVRGDVGDRDSLAAAFAGAQAVFHDAGLISITAGQEARLTATNVEGTRNVVEACVTAKVQRLTYTGSIHALPEPASGGTLDETFGFDPAKAYGPYGRSKAAASKLVQDAARDGRLDAVLVLPSGVLGPFDFQGSEAGNLVSLTGRGRMPVLISGGYDWVDVRDVARGTIAAAEQGRTGEAYLLTGRHARNVELCAIIAKAAGVHGPYVTLPLWLARVFSYGGLAWEYVTGRRSLLTPYSVHTLTKDFDVSNQKARTELGYAPRPLEETLADAWQWLKTEPKSPLNRPRKVAPGRRALPAK